MKKTANKYLILSLIASMAFMISCESGPENEVELLKEEKDSLREVKGEISERIGEIDERLAKLDTTTFKNIPVVTTSSLKKDVFRHYFKVQGVIETDKNAQINADVAAKILKIHAKEGQNVRKGQMLIELDSRVLQNNIEELKTQIELATTVYEKQKSLWDQNIGSEVQYLEAKTNKESLEAKLATAYSQLEYYNIKAPFAGVVDEIMPKVGEMAAPGIPLVRIMNLDHVYLKADISENYLSKIKVGDTALISFPSVNYEVKSSISRIGSFINPNNRTFKVRFELENKDNILIPNLLASVQILDYVSEEERFIIPTKLLQETPQGDEFVFVVQENGNNRAKKLLVESGVSYKGEIEILSGLSDGDKVITKGARGIKDGELITVSDI